MHWVIDSEFALAVTVANNFLLNRLAFYFNVVIFESRQFSTNHFFCAIQSVGWVSSDLSTFRQRLCFPFLRVVQVHARQLCVNIWTNLSSLSSKHFTLPHTGRALTNWMLWHLLPVRHHHRHQSLAKKLTHPKFSGGYLLLHYPSTQSNDFLNNNQIHESYNDDNMMSNDITERKSDNSMKNKYTMRFRRNVDRVMIEHCCSPGNACGQHFCHRWQRFWSERTIFTLLFFVPFISENLIQD